CTQPPQAAGKNKVTIENDRVLIHPGATISDADRDAMNAILKHYTKSLYKIRTYQNGKIVSTKGKLADLQIDKALASEVALAADRGFSDSVMQISCKDRQEKPPPPPASSDRHIPPEPLPTAPPNVTDHHVTPPLPNRGTKAYAAHSDRCDSDELN